MKAKEFFTSTIIRNTFDSSARNRVQNYMQGRGYLADFSPTEAAVSLIFLSCTATKEDLENFGDALLEAETTYRQPEPLLEVIRFILSDELNAATVERLTFDRMNGAVYIRLIDETEIKAVDLPVPVTPDWGAAPGVEFSRLQLCSLANDLSSEFIKGEIIHDKFNEN